MFSTKNFNNTINTDIAQDNYSRLNSISPVRSPNSPFKPVQKKKFKAIDLENSTENFSPMIVKKNNEQHQVSPYSLLKRNGSINPELSPVHQTQAMRPFQPFTLSPFMNMKSNETANMGSLQSPLNIAKPDELKVDNLRQFSSILTPPIKNKEEITQNPVKKQPKFTVRNLDLKGDIDMSSPSTAVNTEDNCSPMLSIDNNFSGFENFVKLNIEVPQSPAASNTSSTISCTESPKVTPGFNESSSNTVVIDGMVIKDFMPSSDMNECVHYLMTKSKEEKKEAQKLAALLRRRERAKTKLRRFRKNVEQQKLLINEYKKNPIWSKAKISELSQYVDLKESQIYKWNWDMRKKDNLVQ